MSDSLLQRAFVWPFESSSARLMARVYRTRFHVCHLVLRWKFLQVSLEVCASCGFRFDSSLFLVRCISASGNPFFCKGTVFCLCYFLCISIWWRALWSDTSSHSPRLLVRHLSPFVPHAFPVLFLLWFPLKRLFIQPKLRLVVGPVDFSSSSAASSGTFLNRKTN